MRSILLSLCLLMVLVSLLLSIIAGFLIRFMRLRPFV
jgi:ribose/xylose/arabinose/galactoside ABC-type transport system permease subunit